MMWITDIGVWFALFAWLTLGSWLLATGRLWLTSRRLPNLGEAPMPEESRLPSVTAIVPLRNEAESIASTLRSLLDQKLPMLEVIAVDDRSDDGSGEILRALRAKDDRLKLIRVEHLPPQWLGKNHACHLGAGQATGEILLFTDGDILFASEALPRALSLMKRLNLGHLAVSPHLLARGFLERAFQFTFGIFFMLRFRVWALGRPGSSAFVGVGAFNMVTREAYERIGGHRLLAMEVVDDVKLGLVLRRSGVRQALALSNGLVSVRWLAGYWASLRGLQKNLFAGMEWSWWSIARRVGGLAIGVLLPWIALFLGEPMAMWAAGAGGVLIPCLLLGSAVRRTTGGTGLEGLLYPLMALSLVGACLVSAVVATWRGEIVWRETRYPLRALRAGCVREKNWPAAKAVGWN